MAKKIQIKRKIVFLATVIIVFLLFVGTIAYLKQVNNSTTGVTKNTSVQNPTIDTDNWKTYENSSLGYSIKLPPEFRFEKTNDSADVEMISITSPDRAFSVNFQSSRFYTVMQDWVKETFGTSYVKQIKVSGDESSLLRTNNNNYPMNNSYEVGFYVYRNPIFYQLYSQRLKPEYVELFKTITSTFQTLQVANKFEMSADNQPRSNDLFNLSPALTQKTNWNNFTDSYYQMTVSYPNSWSAKNLPRDYDNRPTFEVSANNVYSSAPTEKKRVWMRVGDIQQFSTAGGVCYNQICEEVGKATFSIKGKQYSASIIRASSNKYGDPKQNVFGYYAFQFVLTDKGDSKNGFSEHSQPAVTAYFYTREEGQLIVDIISTIIY